MSAEYKIQMESPLETRGGLMKPYYDHHKGDFRRLSLFPGATLYLFTPNLRYASWYCSLFPASVSVPLIFTLPYVEEFIVAIRTNDETSFADTVVTTY